MLTRSKCASKFSISGMFQYYWIYFLFTFYFQGKKTQLKECIKPFFLFCLQILTAHSFILSIYETSSIRASSQFCFHSSTSPFPHSQPFCNIPFLSSQARPHASVHIYPSCADPCRSSANCWPQSSFRRPILGEDVQTGAPKLPIMTGRLWFLLSPPNKLLRAFK